MTPQYSDGDDALRELAARAGMEFVDRISEIAANPAAIVSRAQALSYTIVPLSFKRGRYRIAISDPLDFEVLDSMAFLLRTALDDIDFVVCPARQIETAILLYYPAESS